MAIQRVKLVCEGPSTLSFYGEYEDFVIEDIVEAGCRHGDPLVSFTDILGNRLSVAPHKVVLIMAELVTPDDETDIRAEVAVRQMG